MSYSIKYKELFQVKVLHRFFLNNGLEDFGSMSGEVQEKRLESYNFQTFVGVVPTAETQRIINGRRLAFQAAGNGFKVWAKVDETDNQMPFISLDDDLSLSFLLQIKDPLLYNYTDLKPENTGKFYYLSNRRLATEPNSFPLIDKAGGNFNIDEDFILSDEGESAELEQLQVGEKRDLLGIVRIFMKGDNSSLNVTDNQGKIADPFEQFELNLKNRSTTWRYLFDTKQQVTGGDDVKKENGDSKILVTKSEQPLTQTGFISIELGGVELPNPGSALIKPDTANNKIFSEVYM